MQKRKQKISPEYKSRFGKAETITEIAARSRSPPKSISNCIGSGEMSTDGQLAQKLLNPSKSFQNLLLQAAAAGETTPTNTGGTNQAFMNLLKRISDKSRGSPQPIKTPPPENLKNILEILKRQKNSPPQRNQNKVMTNISALLKKHKNKGIATPTTELMAEAVAHQMMASRGPIFPGRGISEISRQSALPDKISTLAQNPNQQIDNSNQISLLEMKKHSLYLQFINDLSSK